MSAQTSITILLTSQGSQSTSQMVLKWRPKPPSFFFHCEHRDVLIIQQKLVKWLERWKCPICMSWSSNYIALPAHLLVIKVVPLQTALSHPMIALQANQGTEAVFCCILMDEAIQFCVWRATEQLQSTTQYTVSSYKLLLVLNAHLLVQTGDRYGIQSKVFIHQGILQNIQEENISTQCISHPLTGKLCVLWDLPAKLAHLESGKTNMHWPESCRRLVKYP